MSESPDFKFNIGDEVFDCFTGTSGVVVEQEEGMYNYNYYEVLLRNKCRSYFDEHRLMLSKERNAGKAAKVVLATNR